MAKHQSNFQTELEARIAKWRTARRREVIRMLPLLPAIGLLTSLLLPFVFAFVVADPNCPAWLAQLLSFTWPSTAARFLVCTGVAATGLPIFACATTPKPTMHDVVLDHAILRNRQSRL